MCWKRFRAHIVDLFADSRFRYRLEVGADVTEVIALVMTEAGRRAVEKSQPLDARAAPKTGVDSGRTADLLVFSRQTEGSSAAESLTGAYLSPADGFNKAYYGKVVTARAVFERKEVYNRDASKLVSLVMRYGKARRR